MLLSSYCITLRYAESDTLESDMNKLEEEIDSQQQEQD
jgi:hypothetical protein